MKSALLLAGLLLVPSAVGVPFLQTGVDAARTGFTTDPGPSTFDRSFMLDLGEGASSQADVPVIIGANAYVITDKSVWKISLENATARPLVHHPSPTDDNSNFGEIDALASDGERLFYTYNGFVYAISLDGEVMWPTPVPLMELGTETFQNCRRLAVTDELVIVPCYSIAAFGTNQGAALEVLAIHRERGTVAWRWNSDLIADQSDLTGASPVPTPEILSAPAPGLSTIVDTAVVGDQLYISSTNDAPRYSGALFESPRSTLRAISLIDGRQSWRWDQPIDIGAFGTGIVGQVATEADGFHRMGLAGFEDQLIVNGKELSALENGTVAWSVPTNSEDLAVGSVAVIGELVVAPVTDGIFFANARTSASQGHTSTNWRWDLQGQMVAAGGFIYAGISGGMAAVSLDGGVLWSRGLGTPSSFAVGENALVVQAGPIIHVFGDLPPSIGFDAELNQLYPEIDEFVSLAISAPREGASGGPERYRISWGDGAFDVVEDVGNVGHAFSGCGLRQVSVVAINQYGQEASHVFSVDVCGTPPANLNWVQKAAQPENYDLTFGVLGLAIAFTGALIALARARRRRNRISQELDAIDRAAQATESNPTERAAAMNERRAHVRGLLLDGRIDESQLKILEDRIDELARGGRMESLQGRFDFLPYGFVRQVQEMLSDGRLSGWEHDQLGKVLAADESLTATQKKRVRGLLSDWAKEDA